MPGLLLEVIRPLLGLVGSVRLSLELPLGPVGPVGLGLALPLGRVSPFLLLAGLFQCGITLVLDLGKVVTGDRIASSASRDEGSRKCERTIGACFIVFSSDRSGTSVLPGEEEATEGTRDADVLGPPGKPEALHGIVLRLGNRPVIADPRPARPSPSRSPGLSLRSSVLTSTILHQFRELTLFRTVPTKRLIAP